MKTKAPVEFTKFDIVNHLENEEAIIAYINAAIDDEDPDFILTALGDIARARGMTQVAADAGLGRESLYKALSPGAKPRFDTVLKVMQALGIRLRAEAA